ncbi:hypothetical protein ACKGJO_00885 [Gracilimonas sp. Q87]|uniref:hypothetical protein n=1 Tax=Gracilimonas sp. Q87 TaxID=3384766 RepID=UPI0039844A71
MNNYTINVPARLTGKKISDLFELSTAFLKVIEQYDRVTFDISKCNFINPAGTVLLSAFRDIYKERNPTIETYIRYKKSSRVTKILQSWGLYTLEELFHDSYVKSISNYAVPLERCSCTDECLQVHNKIMDHVKDRTECTKNTFASLDYILNEIWDNAGTHGYKCYYTEEYPKPIYFQSFSYKSGVEIAILDLGQGIANSLKSKEKYRNFSTDQILKKALEEKVTGHPNSSPGYGLYSSSELIKSNSGELHIWSSGRSVNVTNSSTRTGIGGFDNGTLVYLKIKAQIDTKFEEIMNGRNVENYLEDHQITL